jgi:hypothetical protein
MKRGKKSSEHDSKSKKEKKKVQEGRQTSRWEQEARKQARASLKNGLSSYLDELRLQKANNSNFVMVKCGVFFEVLLKQGSASKG